MSNLNGTTLYETGCIVINICATYFLCQVVKSLLPFAPLRRHSFVNFLVEHGLLIIPMVLVTTVLSSISYIFHLFIWSIAFALYLLIPNRRSAPVAHPSSHSRLIEIFRGQIFFVTCLCILSVDFPIFPRRYAKTENFGHSGMDLGVGLFALAHGMVSSEARHKSSSIKEFLLENILLLLLGLVRLIAVKYVSYVEHITEYGIHWNFFLTLCLMKCLGNLLLKTTTNLPVLIALTVFFHEWILLRYLGYDQYLLSTSTVRTHFLDANREGIFSLGGYVSLYLIGILIGRFVIDSERQRRSERMLAVFLLATIGLCSIRGNASRKLCNLAYISSTTGLASMCLFAFTAIQSLLERKSCSDESILLKNVNQKGLDTFLLANVLTGLVNLNINTLDTAPSIALAILVMYMTLVSGFAYFFPSLIKLVLRRIRPTT